jgi:hypothetical protein
MNRHAGDTPLSVEIGVAGNAPTISVKPLQGVRAKSSREPHSDSGKLASGAQVLRRWHQLLANSSTVRELNNDVYQLQEQERKILQKQAAKKKLTNEETEVLAQLGRLREIADNVTLQRTTAFALEDAAVVAFHESTEPPSAELQRQLEDANREWDRLLLRLYALSAPSGDRVTLALFGEHRGHLTDMAAAYRAAASDNGLSVEMIRYELPGEHEPAVSPPPSPSPPTANLADPPTTIETQRLKTVWHQDRLWAVHTNPAKLLLKRVAVVAAQPQTYTDEGTLGLALHISGSGSHLRFWSETGVHEITSFDDREGENPHVMVKVSGDSLASYRPPESCVRRGWYRDIEVRRQYDLNKREMHDGDLERVWSNVRGDLMAWIPMALTANVRARLLKMIVE